MIPWTRRGLALLATSALAVAACSSSPDAPASSGRVCNLKVWHKPASAEAHVEIVGEWDGWKRPGRTPDVQPDGWRAAAFDLPPGEHEYAIVEDGVWLTDKTVPMMAYKADDGQEVSLAVVPDCDAPLLTIDGVDATADGHATVKVTFAPARTGASVDPASVTVDPPGLAVAAIDGGALRLEASGLSRGKYIYSIRARDTNGAVAPEIKATVWVEPTRWDPRDTIVYQVMIDRFRGDAGPLAPPATPSSRAGGTVRGVHKALEDGYFASLGVNTLWLSPLYANPEGEFVGNDGRMYTSYHGYWPTRSRELDARFASEADLDAFMRAAHERGVRVLFDVVPNHVHEQHPWVKEHADWFNPGGCVCGQGSCDWGGHIKTCWFAPYLPDLDWRRLDVARAATDDVMWWFDRWGADGLRIDAVPMMQRAATRRIMTAVRTRYEHPGNVPYVLGENFTGPGGYQILRYDLGPFGLDGSFNFPLMWTLRDVVAIERAPMSELDASYRAGLAAWEGSGAVMGQMIGNHDVSRFASVAAGSDQGDAWTSPPQPLDPIVYAKQRVALATVLTLPGAPVVYYGDEVGLAGRSDPDCRRVMPAEDALSDTQRATRDLAGKIGRARACSPSLRRGSLTTILAEREAYVFARPLDVKEGSADLAIVALTRRPTAAFTVSLPPGAPTAYVDVVTGQAFDGALGTLTFPADDFGVHVLVPKGGGCAP